MGGQALTISSKYLATNRRLIMALSFTDNLLSFLMRHKRNGKIKLPEKILLSNIGHMGDVIITTSVLPVIKKAFPGTKIGFLTAGWSKQVLEDHPLVDFIHTVDPWKSDRSDKTLPEKIANYLKTRRVAVKEIKKTKYDIAVDLYYHFPNSISLLWETRIPIRVGYTSGGLGPLLTHSLDWVASNKNVAEYQADLLRLLTPLAGEKLRPSLAIHKDEVCELAKKLGCASLSSASYIVMHIGTGQKAKEWMPEKWRALIEKFQDTRYRLVFTGLGDEEFGKIERVIKGFDNCVNMCNRLNWREFVSVVRNAKLLIGLNSMAIHTASAASVPSVAIFSGIDNIHRWAPLSEKFVAVSHGVSCAPCNRSKGCEAMDCLRNIDPDEVYRLSLNFLTGN